MIPKKILVIITTQQSIRQKLIVFDDIIAEKALL